MKKFENSVKQLNNRNLCRFRRLTAMTAQVLNLEVAF